MAARRWLLFGLSLASLLAMTYAGVSLAFSLKVTPEMAASDPDAKLGSRMVIHLIGGPAEVQTLANGEAPDLLAMGEPVPFIARATDVTLGRALAYAAPDANGTYSPATVLTGDGREVNVTALAAGGTGWIVQSATMDEPLFVPEEKVLGEVARVENATILPALFILGVVGFLVPLITIVVTHRGAGPRAPAGHLCRECRAPMSPGAEFCMRCGAYAREA